MYQLGLVHGDLMIGTDGSYLTVTGAQRIQQDLTLALSDIYGTDRFHPSWGSILPNYLGNINNASMQTLVKAEVNRVIQNYLIITQSGVIQQSMVNVTNNNNPGQSYSTADVVRSVNSITVSATMDTIYVSVSLTTLAGQSITVGQKIGS
jgi:phage baseplate assembly protein W